MPEVRKGVTLFPIVSFNSLLIHVAIASVVAGELLFLFQLGNKEQGRAIGKERKGERERE